jgi:hypothetical protein
MVPATMLGVMSTPVDVKYFTTKPVEREQPASLIGSPVLPSF